MPPGNADFGLSTVSVARRIEPADATNPQGDPLQVEAIRVVPNLDGPLDPSATNGHVALHCVLYGRPQGPRQTHPGIREGRADGGPRHP